GDVGESLRSPRVGGRYLIDRDRRRGARRASPAGWGDRGQDGGQGEPGARAAEVAHRVEDTRPGGGRASLDPVLFRRPQGSIREYLDRGIAPGRVLADGDGGRGGLPWALEGPPPIRRRAPEETPRT